MGTHRNMVASFPIAFSKPSATGTCAAGFSVATSYGIRASNAQFPHGHQFGSIATIQGTHWQIPQQWVPTSDITKTKVTTPGQTGDVKLVECVSGYPEVANGFGKFA